MKQKRICSLFLVFLLMSVCFACGSKPETAEQVVQKMQIALTNTPASKARIVTDMKMELEISDSNTQEITTTITNDMTISQEPISSYTTSTTAISYGNEPIETFSEYYSTIENGNLVYYSHSSGVWSKLSTSQTLEDFVNSSSSINIDMKTASIDRTVSEIDGNEVICLTTQLSGSSMGSTLESILNSIGLNSSIMQEAADIVSSFDLSSLACDFKIILDKDTYLPISENINIDGLSEMLAPLYNDIGIPVDVTRCSAEISFLSYEPQAAIELPENASKKAATWERLIAGDPENGDGTFTIREGSYLLDIMAPEGFKVAEKGYDHVYFSRDDNRQVKYTVHYGSAEYFSTKVEERLSSYGDLPKNIYREQMTLNGDLFSFDCDIIGVDWTSYEEGVTYAWAELGTDDIGTYYIFVEVTDGYNDGLGNKKSADMTPKEFIHYLNAVTMSDLME